MAVLQSGAMWALASAVLWASAVILFRLAGESIPPMALNLYKGVVAIAIFVPVLAWRSRASLPAWPPRTWALLAFSGVVGIAVADTLYFVALNRIGAALTAVVNCLYFPLIAVLAAVVLRERMPAASLVGGVLVVAGILVGSAGGPDARLGRRAMLGGVAINVTSLLAMAIGLIAVQPILTREPVLWTTTVRLVFGTIALAPLVLFGPDRGVFVRLVRPSRLWRHALPGAVLGGALAMLAWIAGFAMTETTRAAILNQLSTIFVFVLAAIVLEEPVTTRRLAAMALAFAGAVLVIAAP